MLDRILKHSTHRQILISALLLGLALRCLSAWYVWGPQALDDFMDVLEPAWKFSIGQDTGIHDYRSPLFIWIIGSWIKFGGLFGISKAVAQIRWVYFFLAVSSLTGILGVDLLIPKTEKNLLKRILPLFLMAAYGLMPFISTRSFLEAFAMGYMTLAFGLLELARKERKISPVWGFALLGFSTLVRFQLGVMYVGYLVVLAVLRDRRGVTAGILVGFGLLAIESVIDLSIGRPALITILTYVSAAGHPQDYGVSPWYSTWLTWLAAMYFPFTLLFWRKFRSAWEQHKIIAIMTLLFVGIHSLYPHKEERFIYPILGFSFVLWGTAWAESMDSKWIRRIYLPIFLVLNTTLLVIGCLLNTQIEEIGPAAAMQDRSDSVLYLDYDSLMGRGWMYQFFLRPPAVMKRVTEPLSEDSVRAQIATGATEFPFEGIAILTMEPEPSEILAGLAGQKIGDYQCDSLKKESTLIDGLIYRMNPIRNRRRRPEWYLDCWRTH